MLKILNFFKIKKTAIILTNTAIITSSTLIGCQTQEKSLSNDNKVTASDFKLDTYVYVTIYGKEANQELANEAINLCDKYENIFSMYNENSELYKVNNNSTTTISTDLGKAIQKGLEISKLSKGNFQISIGAVSCLWDFSSGKGKVPSKEAINKVLPFVDDSKITVEPKEANNPNGDWIIKKDSTSKIDLGAISKGYIAEEIKSFLVKKGVTSAIINLGGNVLCLGQKPDGESFSIGIQKPFADSGTSELVLLLNNKSLVSSGIYERYFKDANGKIYHHILNPKTGYPYDTNLYQVSIISDNSFDGDCLSTLCFCLGIEKSKELIESLNNTEAIFEDASGKRVLTSGAMEYIKK